MRLHAIAVPTIGILILLGCFVPPAPGQTSGYSTEFSSCSLDSGFVYADGHDCTPVENYHEFVSRPGFLRLTTTGSTDHLGGGDNAPKILHAAPQQDFAIETYLEGQFDVTYEHAGLLMRADAANWIKIIRDTNFSQSVVVYYTVGGSSTAYNAVPYSDDWVYLRLESVQGMFRGLYSVDGSTWFVVAELPDMIGPISQYGVLAVSTPSGNVLPVDFDFLRAYVGTPTAAPVRPGEKERPLRLELATPNPFREGVIVVVRGGPASRMVADVVNPAGRVVRVLRDGSLPEGATRIRWDGRNARGAPVAAGVYWMRCSTPGERAFKKLVLIR